MRINAAVHKEKYKHYIKYYPEFKMGFGSEKAAIIFERLEYWSQRYSSGFWKFFEPCEHPLYREGDSWQEETGFSRKAFNKVFPLIGIHYKSKSAFLKQSDPFQGKLYASYYDRKTNRTYFLRNHSFVREFLEKTWNRVKTTIQKDGRRGSQNGRSCNGHAGRSFTRAYKDIFPNKEILHSPLTPSEPLETPQASTQEKERDVLEKGVEHIAVNWRLKLTPPHCSKNRHTELKVISQLFEILLFLHHFSLL